MIIINDNYDITVKKAKKAVIIQSNELLIEDIT